jgi:hypothetical protein
MLIILGLAVRFPDSVRITVLVLGVGCIVAGATLPRIKTLQDGGEGLGTEIGLVADVVPDLLAVVTDAVVRGHAAMDGSELDAAVEEGSNRVLSDVSHVVAGRAEALTDDVVVLLRPTGEARAVKLEPHVPVRVEAERARQEARARSGLEGERGRGAPAPPDGTLQDYAPDHTPGAAYLVPRHQRGAPDAVRDGEGEEFS